MGLLDFDSGDGQGLAAGPCGGGRFNVFLLPGRNYTMHCKDDAKGQQQEEGVQDLGLQQNCGGYRRVQRSPTELSSHGVLSWQQRKCEAEPSMGGSSSGSGSSSSGRHAGWKGQDSIMIIYGDVYVVGG